MMDKIKGLNDVWQERKGRLNYLFQRILCLIVIDLENLTRWIGLPKRVFQICRSTFFKLWAKIESI
jgi:hypothetical protein